MELTDARAHIFDFDGTFADSMWVWEQVDRDFMERCGISFDQNNSEAMAALGFEGSADYFIKTYGITDTPEEMIAEWQGMAGEIYATKVGLKEHALDYLLSLKQQGCPVAIATSLQRQLLEPALKNNGVLELFDVIAICEEICRTGKSTPAVYEHTAEMLGVPLEQCAVYEDVALAARSAKTGGAYVVGVRDDHPQQNRPQLLEACDLFIQGFGDLL